MLNPAAPAAAPPGSGAVVTWHAPSQERRSSERRRGPSSAPSSATCDGSSEMVSTSRADLGGQSQPGPDVTVLTSGGVEQARLANSRHELLLNAVWHTKSSMQLKLCDFVT